MTMDYTYTYFHEKINQLRDLSDASYVKSESQDLTVKLHELKLISKKLHEAKKEYELLGELSGRPLSEIEFFTDLQSNVKKINLNFNAKPTSQSITKGRSFIIVQELANDATRNLENEFKQYKTKLRAEKFKSCERPSVLEAKLVMTPENKSNYYIYKQLFFKVDEIFQKTSASLFKSNLAEIDELSIKLQEVRGKFSEDYPDFVNNFFEQVAQNRGVDLESISVELLEWLSQNSLSNNYRVSRKNDSA